MSQTQRPCRPMPDRLEAELERAPWAIPSDSDQAFGPGVAMTLYLFITDRGGALSDKDITTRNARRREVLPQGAVGRQKLSINRRCSLATLTARTTVTVGSPSPGLDPIGQLNVAP